MIADNKMSKKLNQIGLNRVLWLLVKKSGGRFVVSGGEIGSLSDVELKMGYDKTSDSFIFIATRKKKIVTSEEIFVP